MRELGRPASAASAPRRSRSNPCHLTLTHPCHLTLTHPCHLTLTHPCHLTLTLTLTQTLTLTLTPTHTLTLSLTLTLTLALTLQRAPLSTHRQPEHATRARPAPEQRGVGVRVRVRSRARARARARVSSCAWGASGGGARVRSVTRSLPSAGRYRLCGGMRCSCADPLVRTVVQACVADYFISV